MIQIKYFAAFSIDIEDCINEWIQSTDTINYIKEIKINNLEFHEEDYQVNAYIVYDEIEDKKYIADELSEVQRHINGIIQRNKFSTKQIIKLTNMVSDIQKIKNGEI